MIYTDEELRRWWNRLTEQDRSDLFERATEWYEQQSDGSRGLDFIQSIQSQWSRGKGILTPKQLAALRKWDRS